MTKPTTTGKAQDLITFTRSTTGTYLGSDGLLKSAAINEARIEYDASGNCLGLLVEEARTNQAKHSEDWTTSSWTLKENSFSSSTNSIAPDGTAGATRFYTNSNVPAFLQQVCPGSVGSKAHTVSCWVRATNGGSGQTFRLKATHSGVTDFFSDNKTATSEWQRFIFTTTFISASNTAVIAGIVEDSSANQFDIEVWGMQVEFDASFPTSYVPTSGSAVTRAADLASLAVSEFGYNQDQGSVVVESNFFGGTNTNTLCYIGEDTSDRILLYYSNKNLSFQVKSSGALQATKSLSGQRNKAAYRYKLNDMNLAGNGDTTVADTSANLLGGTQDNIYIGSYYHNAGAHLNGHIKSIKYYPVGLSNAQLQALTV